MILADGESTIDFVKKHPGLVATEDFEVVVEKSRTRLAGYLNGKCRHEKETREYWVSLRVLHQGQPGQAVCLSPTPENLDEMVDQAIYCARNSTRDPYFRFPLVRKQEDESERIDCPGNFFRSLGRDIRGISALEESLEQLDHSLHFFRNEEKLQKSFQGSHFRETLSVLDGKGEQFFWLKQSRSSRSVPEDRAGWLEGLCESSQEMAGNWSGESFSPKNFSLVVDSSVMASLLSAMSPWFCADRVSEGKGPLVDRLGETVFSEAVTLVDDGRVGQGGFSSAFDWEGTPTQKTLLVDKGALSNLLFDSSHGARKNRPSTGNYCRRPGTRDPFIGPSHLELVGGDQSVDQLLHAAWDGFYLTQIDPIESWGALGAAKSFTAMGWRIRGGKLTGRVQRVSYEGDLLPFLANVKSLGSDSRLWGSVRCTLDSRRECTVKGSRMKLKSYSITDIGRRRKVNQDSFFHDDGMGLFIVADGMSGHKGGEVASQICVETISQYRRDNTDMSARDVLDKGINHACKAIFDKAKEDEDLAGMGTTVISLLVDGDLGYFGHVGDSRAYLLKEEGIWQVSEDHSLMNEELRAGRLHAGQVENYQFKNVITRSVGYENQVAVDIYRRKIQKGDTFLLCTDGLSGLVEIQEMFDEVKKSGPDKALTNLVNMANDRGGDDNITAVICEILEA